MTNWHIVSGKNAATGEQDEPEVPDELIVHHHGQIFGQSVPRSEPLFDGGIRRWRQHPLHGHKVDVGVLPLSNVDEAILFYPYVLDAGPKMLIGPTDPLSVVGFPFGLSSAGLAIWATGFTASEPDIDHTELPLFLLDCRARKGQSGSPVIAYRSAGAPFRLDDGGTMQVAAPVFRLFGIYSGRVNSESDLGHVWKVSAIRSTLLNGK
ncbi:MAG TPA: hypothetical protein VK540_13965 [Polyangiaceae bacterium]|nr:hypothetical protein [Polyangiaceae bacterium]